MKDRLMTRYVVSGEIIVNGKCLSAEQMASLVSSVPQHDEGLLPTLTVRETLRFAAALRLPDLSNQAKHEKAERLLLRMGLKSCADILIGDETTKGISGGEKRR